LKLAANQFSHQSLCVCVFPWDSKRNQNNISKLEESEERQENCYSHVMSFEVVRKIHFCFSSCGKMSAAVGEMDHDGMTASPFAKNHTPSVSPICFCISNCFVCPISAVLACAPHKFLVRKRRQPSIDDPSDHFESHVHSNVTCSMVAVISVVRFGISMFENLNEQWPCTAQLQQNNQISLLQPNTLFAFAKSVNSKATTSFWLLHIMCGFVQLN